MCCRSMMSIASSCVQRAERARASAWWPWPTRSCPAITTSRTIPCRMKSDLILLGFLAFLDPPKETAAEALKQLHALNVDVKILTGDNEIVTTYICRQVGLPVDSILLGSRDRSDDRGRAGRGRRDVTSVFAKLVANPKGAHHPCAAEQGPRGGLHGRRHQRRAGAEGRRRGHLGGQRGGHRQGILRHHPAGKQPAGAGAGCDRRPAGVRQHHQVHQDGGQLQLRQYVQRLGASMFLPFLPMLPIQVLTNNLLYDFSQTDHPHRQGGCRMADQAAQMGRSARSGVSSCLSARSARSSIT